MYSPDVQCSLEVALWANDVQVNNEQRAGAIVTEELVSSILSSVYRCPYLVSATKSVLNVFILYILCHLRIASKTLSVFQRSEFEQFWASHVTTPLEGRNSIVASFCPQVFGLYVVKLSVCLALIGGVEVGGAARS